MFNNRLFNILIGLVIAVLAVLSIGNVMYSQQAASNTADNRFAPLDWYLNHPHTVSSENENASDYSALANRIPSSAYVSAKDRALDQLDRTSNQVASVNLSGAERYAAVKASQLEQAEAMTAAEAIGIAVTGSAKPTNAERYANLKDAQLAQWDHGEAISAGRARYMNFKDDQLAK